MLAMGLLFVAPTEAKAQTSVDAATLQNMDFDQLVALLLQLVAQINTDNDLNKDDDAEPPVERDDVLFDLVNETYVAEPGQQDQIVAEIVLEADERAFLIEELQVIIEPWEYSMDVDPVNIEQFENISLWRNGEKILEKA